MSSVKRVGVLTGGGDAPGLNPAIKGLVYRGSDRGLHVIGLFALGRSDDAVIFDPKIGDFVASIDRIDDPATLQENEHLGVLPKMCRDLFNYRLNGWCLAWPQRRARNNGIGLAFEFGCNMI